MRSFFLALCLALLPNMLLAQSNTNPDLPIPPCVTEPTGIYPLQPVTAPPTLPRELGGTGTKAIVEVNLNGGVAGWWSIVDGQRRFSAYAVRWSAVTPEMRSDFMGLFSIPLEQRREAIRVMLEKHQRQNFFNMGDVWCGDWRRLMNLAAPDLLPAGPIWKTPASGTGTLYNVVNGARSAIIPDRKAPSDTECDCTSSIKYFTATYCPLKGGPPNEVTLCRQQ